ncbi:hypothetical protein R4I97_09430 [Brachyspira pilosicoli]|uniref:hypothetical protein n=1 Tax=Brachyspira pilosicoli TaxID=52584 RepID=UPI003005A3C7
MFKKNIGIKLYILLIVVYTIAFFSLYYLGSKTRKGYLEISFNENYVNKTLELNNLESIKEQFFVNNKLDINSINNYIITNENIKKYFYDFKLQYYSKIFMYSDIYYVYVDTNKFLKDNDFIKEITMHQIGKQYGSLISSSSLYDKKIEFDYTLGIKEDFIYVLLSLYIILILYFVYYHILNFDKLSLFIYSKLDNSQKDKVDGKNISLLNDFFQNFIKSFITSLIILLILIVLKLGMLKVYSLFLVSFVIIFYLYSNKRIIFLDNFFNKYIFSIKYKKLVFFFILISILTFFILFKLVENDYIFNINNILNFISLFIITFIIFIILKRFSNTYLFIFLSIISLLLIVYKKYVPAIEDVFHHTSHFTSVFFVHNGIPYQDNMYSILGHYAILMEPFFKIFGLNVNTYSILLAILAGISIVFIIITIFILIEDNFYRNIAILLLILLYFTLNNERPRFTVFRILFPSIVMGYLAIINTKKNIVFISIGYLLASLAILFNVESGLVTIFSLSVANVYIYCYDYNFKDKRLYINLFFFFLLSIFSILLSFAIFNIYNVYVLGGEIQDFKSLLFPLFTDQVSNTALYQIKLIDFFIQVFLILIFLIPFMFYLNKMSIFRGYENEKIKKHYALVIYICISALGLYSYNINRYHITHNVIVFPMLVVIIPFILNKLFSNIYVLDNEEKKKYIIYIQSFIILLILVLYTCSFNFNIVFSERSKKLFSYLKTKNTEENGITSKVTEYIKKYGYDGIVSFGGPFVYGYANLGWTNSLILPNESDWWNPQLGYTKVVEMFLEKSPDVFLSGKELYNISYYYNTNYINSVNFFNDYVLKNYTNVKTEYEKYNFYFYQKIK